MHRPPPSLSPPSKRQHLERPQPRTTPPTLFDTPAPSTYTPAELEIDTAFIPSLPPLPPTSAHQVFLHKSAVGTLPLDPLRYETISYKPLEFFGDAVVEYHVSRVLRKRYSQAGPGVLTHLRSRLVDNRMLGFIGWRCGLAPYIQFQRNSPFDGDEGRNVPQQVLAEVFEAYIGALAEDDDSADGLKKWFDDVFGKDSKVFPKLDEEAKLRETRMYEAMERRSGQKENGAKLDSSFKETNAEHELARLACDCTARSNAATLFTFDDENLSSGALRGPNWHTSIRHNGVKLGCGRGAKRLDARQEAWASALASSMGLLPLGA